MFELIVGENFVKRLCRAAAACAKPRTAANPSADQTAAPVLGRDYAPAGPLRLAAPRLAAQIGWLLPLALMGSLAAWWRHRGSPGRERLQLALWAGSDAHLRHRLQRRGRAVSRLLPGGDGAGVVRVGRDRVGRPVVALCGRRCRVAGVSGDPDRYRAMAGYIVDGYRAGYLAIGEKWLVPALLVATGLAAAGLLVMRPPLRAPPSYSAGSPIEFAGDAGGLVGGHRPGQGQYRLPRRAAAIFERSGRDPAQALVAGRGRARRRPQASRLSPGNHQSEAYLLAAVNARQAAPIIIATGDPVMSLGGFTVGTRSSPSTASRAWSKTIVSASRWSATAAPVCGASSEKTAKSPWSTGSKQNGRLVDPARWRTATPNGADGRRDAEAMGAQLYDLRLADDGG